jgi:GT2 family glycosyltransferase
MRDPSASVAVVLVNWNGIDDALDVIGQLDQIEGPPIHRLVVDNGSTDDSVARLRRERPDIELLETGQNLGFAAGNLAGIRHLLERYDCGWVLLLNTDVEVDQGFLPPLIEACLDPQVGAAGPKIYFHQPPDLIWAAGGRLRLRETVTQEFGIREPDGPTWDEAKDVTYLTTCCLLVPRDVLERVGLFDPVFFIGVEDADWCRRALDAGFCLRYVPSSRLWHKVATSTGGSYTPFKTFHTGRSNALYARRHLRLPSLSLFVIANIAAIGGALLRELPRGNAKAVAAKAKGLWRGLRDPLPPPPSLKSDRG